VPLFSPLEKPLGMLGAGELTSVVLFVEEWIRGRCDDGVDGAIVDQRHGRLAFRPQCDAVVAFEDRDDDAGPGVRQCVAALFGDLPKVAFRRGNVAH